MDVCVHGERGNLECMTHHDACGLVADSGEALEFFECLRNLAVVFLDKNFGQVENILALGSGKSAGFDDFGYLFDAEFHHGLGRLRLLVKFLGHLVYAEVGALCAQYDCDQERVGVRVIQRNRWVRKQPVERFTDEFYLIIFFHFFEELLITAYSLFTVAREVLLHTEARSFIVRFADLNGGDARVSRMGGYIADDDRAGSDLCAITDMDVSEKLGMGA
mgnify:CR=1 FL=1